MALVLLSLLTLCAVVPGIAQELSPIRGPTRVVPALEDYQLLGLPHAPAGGPLTWVLCGVVMFTYLVGLRERSGLGSLTGLTVAASTIPLLLATRWAPEVAVASATRWTSALFFLVGSLLVWWRRPLSRFLRGWGIVQPEAGRMAGSSFALLLLLATAPVLAMALFVALAALSLTPPTGGQVELLWWLSWVAVIPLLLVLLGRWSLPDWSDRWSTPAGSLMILTIMPLFAMTAFVVGQALSAHPVVGPDANSLFTRIGLAASYAVPLIILSVALIGHAISFRSEPLAFAAGLLLSFSLTAAYLLGQRVSGAFTTEQWVRLAQLNSIIAATYGICWLGFLWFRRSVHHATQLAGGWRRIQLWIAVGFLLLPVSAMVGILFVSPLTSQAVNVAAGVWGWTALALVALHVLVFFRLQERPSSATLFLVLIYVVLALAALQGQSLQAVWPTARWLTYHLLQLAVAVAGLAVVAVEFWERRRPAVEQAQSTDWLRSAVGLLPLAGLALLSLRSAPRDPLAYWWSVLGLATAAGLSVDRGWRWERQRYLWVAALLLNLAASIWFIDYGYKLMGTGEGVLLEFINMNVVAMAVPVPLWLMLRRSPPADRWGAPGLHSVVTVVALLFFGLAIGLGLIADAVGQQVVGRPWMTALALMATAVASISCLWDPRSLWSVAFCYLTGLLATAALLDALNVDVTAMTWLSALLLSAYGVAASYLWSRRDGLRAAMQQLGVPARADDRLVK